MSPTISIPVAEAGRIPLMACVILCCSLSVTAQSAGLLLKSHEVKLTNAKAYLIDIAKRMDTTSFGYKPVPVEMSFQQQLLHIGTNIYWLSSTFIREEASPIAQTKTDASAMNRDSVLAFVADAFDYAVRSIQILDTATLQKKFPWQGSTMNKIQFLNLIQDHQAHHVGQLIVYLRLNGIAPPRYIGW
jgi:uncharacterized damage-inducible protein DinB